MVLSLSVCVCMFVFCARRFVDAFESLSDGDDFACIFAFHGLHAW